MGIDHRPEDSIHDGTQTALNEAPPTSLEPPSTKGNFHANPFKMP
jgi:hypothetical protein